MCCGATWRQAPRTDAYNICRWLRCSPWRWHSSAKDYQVPVVQSVMNRFLLLPALLLLCTTLDAQLANQPPSPTWLAGAPGYETSFEHQGRLLMAILLVAADREVTI